MSAFMSTSSSFGSRLLGLNVSLACRMAAQIFEVDVCVDGLVKDEPMVQAR